MNLRLRILLAALVALSLSRAVVAQCGTVINTPVFNTTWTTQGSPYCVNATVQVGNLTIQPGVEVRLAPGVSLQVSTWLRALGTRTRPIRFQAQNLAAGRWGGIEFTGPVAPNNPSRLSHCIVTEANNSGVRVLDNDQVSLEECWIHGNTSPLDGGGLRVELSAGVVRVEDCDIERNLAERNGGGVSAATSTGSRLELVRCRIMSNVANPSGRRGGFSGAGIRASGDISVFSCLISGNSVATGTCGGAVSARGGGLHASDGDVRLVGTAIIENVCRAETVNSTCGAQSGAAEGAGIYAEASVSLLSVTNSLVCCNAAMGVGWSSSSRGSGIFSAAQSCIVSNCTIARNSDEGIHLASGAADVRNTIVYFHPAAAIQGAATVNYSNIERGWTGGTGNVRFNPAFVGSGCAPEHFGLSPFSPCIDAGDQILASNDACLPPGQGSARNDIGALGGPMNCSFGGPSTVVCGAQTYGELHQAGESMTLDWTFLQTQPPFRGRLALANGIPLSPGALLLSGNSASFALSGITLLVDASSAGVVPIALDASGSWSVDLDLQIPVLVGVPLLFQGFSLPASGVFRASNGLRLAPCP